MRFTLGRVVHYYYVIVMLALTGLFGYGVKYYWESGLLNIEYVSNLYDGTSKVRAVKERNDIDEIKKFVDGDRIKDANRLFTRLDQDIRDLKSIKPAGEKNTFEDNTKKVKIELANLQSAPELTNILNNTSAKVSAFENFVTEKKWPTLSKMATNLRIKTSPGRLMQGGLYNFEKTVNLTQSVSNDLEAMTNFTESSGLQPNIKTAIVERIKTIKSEANLLNTYIDDHKKFNRTYKDFSSDYQAWFKFVEPEIALKKIQFEKSSQTILYSLIIVFASLISSLTLGFFIYNFSIKRGSAKTEKLILDTIKESLIPIEAKNTDKFSHEFTGEIDKYRDYVHKRMSFGSIFQEAMPFASILLDSNLNLVWGNSHFYEQWKLQNFNDEGGESLSWDFLQRFTNLEDNSSILSALRMSNSGVYRIQLKNTAGAHPLPYEMHVSPVDYSSQKRIMIIFYPMSEVEERISNQKSAITKPMISIIDAQFNETMTPEIKMSLRAEAEKAGGGDLYAKFSQYVEKNEALKDDFNGEIERLETELAEQRSIVGDMRKSLVNSFETQRASVAKYNQFKTSVTAVLDARDQLEEQFKFALSASREFYKDQNKILSSAEKAEKSVDEYLKSLKTITGLKTEFKDLKGNVEEFKSRITQVLDQLLIFQNHEDDTLRVDQFLGKIKLEMKGFEKVLNGFNHVVTQLDVTVTKLDMMVESREKIDLEAIRVRLDAVKNNLENAQFSASRISQNAHSKDDEMVQVLKSLVGNLKSEMKRIDDMCRLTGLTADHLKAISPEHTA
jgi:mRNA-degrading endonuclease YafQ of YafQ-DinJ toxin-antitoxin module